MTIEQRLERLEGRNLRLMQQNGRLERPYLTFLGAGNKPTVYLGGVKPESGGGGALWLGSGSGFEAAPRLLIRAYDDPRDAFIQSKDEQKNLTWTLP